MLSDRKGNFRFAEVAPGNYAVRINTPGFAPWRAASVTVEVGRVTLLSVKLEFAVTAHAKAPESPLPRDDPSPAVSSNWTACRTAAISGHILWRWPRERLQTGAATTR